MTIDLDELERRCNLEGFFSPRSPLQRKDLLELIALARRGQDADEIRQLFDLQHKRTAEADKLWQIANNKPGTLPDLGDLIRWLMERAAVYERALQRIVDATAGKGYIELGHVNAMAREALEKAKTGAPKA